MKSCVLQDETSRMIANLGVAVVGYSPLAAFTNADAAHFSALMPDMPRAAAGRRAVQPTWQGHDRDASAEPSGNWGGDDDEEWTRQKRKVAGKQLQ